MASFFPSGWRPDLPDFRDYTPDSEKIKAVLSQSAGYMGAGAQLPPAVDLRPWCSPVEHQGEMQACTAHTGVALIEYFERRAFGKHIDASRMFLYKVTRNLLRESGDSGAYLRTAMQAMVLFGVPPEEYWPYNTALLNTEPPAFCYAFAQNFQSVKYFRLDPPGAARDKLVLSVKRFLAAGMPIMFGFSLYSNIPRSGDGRGEIAFPGSGDMALNSGHAVVAVGYNDQKPIGSAVGALRIRNSWGEGWGEGGYGWLPYAFVERGLAQDFWCLLKNEYVDTDLFR